MASETNLKTFANAIFAKVKLQTDALSTKITNLTSRVNKNENDIATREKITDMTAPFNCYKYGKLKIIECYGVDSTIFPYTIDSKDFYIESSTEGGWSVPLVTVNSAGTKAFPGYAYCTTHNASPVINIRYLDGFGSAPKNSWSSDYKVYFTVCYL